MGELTFSNFLINTLSQMIALDGGRGSGSRPPQLRGCHQALCTHTAENYYHVFGVQTESGVEMQLWSTTILNAPTHAVWTSECGRWRLELWSKVVKGVGYRHFKKMQGSGFH